MGLARENAALVRAFCSLRDAAVPGHGGRNRILPAMGRRTARVAVQQVGRRNHDGDERLQAASRGHGREALGDSRPAGHPDPAVSVKLGGSILAAALTEAAAIFFGMSFAQYTVMHISLRIRVQVAQRARFTPRSNTTDQYY